MRVTEKSIQGKNIKVQMWGFFPLIHRKAKFLKIIANCGDGLKSYFNGSGEPTAEAEVVGVIQSIVSTLDESTINWFVDNVCDGVMINNQNLKDPEVREIQLMGNTTLFYDIVRFVMEVQYGDFLDLVLPDRNQTL